MGLNNYCYCSRVLIRQWILMTNCILQRSSIWYRRYFHGSYFPLQMLLFSLYSLYFFNNGFQWNLIYYRFTLHLGWVWYSKYFSLILYGSICIALVKNCTFFVNSYSIGLLIGPLHTYSHLTATPTFTPRIMCHYYKHCQLLEYSSPTLMRPPY